MNRKELKGYLNNWNRLLSSYFCEDEEDFIFLDSMSLKIKHKDTSESILFDGRSNSEILAFVEGFLKTHWVIERRRATR